MIDPLPVAIPAATLIVLRDGSDGGAPEILILERSALMTFAAGALVFPGGRIDPGDRELAATQAGEDGDDIAARLAAIRETIEEAGVAIGLTPPTPAATLVAVRKALHDNAALAATLAKAGMALDLDALVPFARWRPAHRHLRIYDTRFYLARWHVGAPPPAVDATENVRLFWASAAETLAMVDAGAAHVIFPTRRTLERLARFATVDEAFADARAHPIETITPWIERRGEVDHLCIPEGLGYPVTAEPLAQARRD